MLTEKNFCKGCGRIIHTNFLRNLITRTFIGFDNGFYCMECARKRIAKRRAELK